ncbi:MAG: hypothetical protein IPI13_07105 [Actinomycetales bacterium]|uniref:Uncharacterized protein n=1 Tax=Candidatus Phosphoribacter hodrii TaxID=2953743 RepID=A0A935M559_9MICO|nr:hypothetical protein [Candidatus Phosphoribacter hodrii]
MSGHFTVPAFAGQILRKTIQQLASPRRWRESRPAAARSDDLAIDWAQRYGQAFTELIEHLPTDRLTGKVAATVVVTLDAQRLADLVNSQPQASGVDTGLTLSAGQARRIACNAGLLPQCWAARRFRWTWAELIGSSPKPNASLWPPSAERVRRRWVRPALRLERVAPRRSVACRWPHRPGQGSPAVRLAPSAHPRPGLPAQRDHCPDRREVSDIPPEDLRRRAVDVVTRTGADTAYPRRPRVDWLGEWPSPGNLGN